MMVDQASKGEVRLNRGLLAGGVLIGVGGLLGVTGMVLVLSAVVSATRRRVNQLDQPPREIAKLRWRQAKVAAAAGRDAWRTEAPSRSSAS
jgi:hypothetical protein